MNKLLKPACIAFYILMLLVFFFIGLSVAGLVEAGKGQMLAGGAIVLGWGVMFGGLAFLLSFFLAYYLNHKIIVRSNWILLLALIILYGITHYRYLEREKARADDDKKEIPIKKQKTELVPKPQSEEELPVKEGSFYRYPKKVIEQKQESNMGIGFFIPDYIEHPTLYFYSGNNLEKGMLDRIPQDSIVFDKDQYNNPTTSYAPPWLYPEHLKLDYGIIIFKAMGTGQNLVKVESNKVTHQVSYIDKSKGVYTSWPDFLMSTNSIEFNENSDRKVYVKPLDHAGEVHVNFELLQPILVEQEWMYVRLLDDNFSEQGTGWIKWKQDNSLLISYSLLS